MLICTDEVATSNRQGHEHLSLSLLNQNIASKRTVLWCNRCQWQQYRLPFWKIASRTCVRPCCRLLPVDDDCLVVVTVKAEVV